jgi:hypothetical protein
VRAREGAATYVALWRAPFEVDPPAMVLVCSIERREVRGGEGCGRVRFVVA